ncbi:hypothetical protein BIW11_10462, partial [Tropilaelaps mercedesae]
GDSDNPIPSITSTSAPRPASTKDDNGQAIAVDSGNDANERAKEVESETAKGSASGDEVGRCQQLPKQRLGDSSSSSSFSQADQLSVSMQAMTVQDAKKDQEVRNQPARTRDQPQAQQQYNNNSSSNNNNYHREDQQHQNGQKQTHGPHSQSSSGQTHNGPTGGPGRHHGPQNYHHSHNHH